MCVPQEATLLAHPPPCPSSSCGPGSPLSAPPHLQPPTPTEACPGTHPLPVTRHLHRRLPDMADYSYSSAPRPCGGSHTLTYPYRRIRLQHLSQGMYPTEEIQIAMKVGTFLAASREGPPGAPRLPGPSGKAASSPLPGPRPRGQFLNQTQSKPQVLFLSWEEDSHPGHPATWPCPLHPVPRPL